MALKEFSYISLQERKWEERRDLQITVSFAWKATAKWNPEGRAAKNEARKTKEGPSLRR